MMQRCNFALARNRSPAGFRRACQVAKAPRSRTKIVSKAKTDEDIGFRFDESMQRWVRDDRFKGKSMTVVRPKSGLPYTVWPVMHTYLVQKGLKSVKQQQAIDLVKGGKAVLVDVRLADDFADQHAEGAINVPMYRITAGDGGWDKFKRIAMASLFMKATERDPNFLANFEKVVPKNKKVVVMCAVGGTLETIVKVETTGKQCKDPERNFGRETRSLKACYELMKGGWKDVVHLGGVCHLGDMKAFLSKVASDTFNPSENLEGMLSGRLFQNELMILLLRLLMFIL